MKNKKRILYLILTVLFTLLLVADVAIALLLPAQNSFGPMGGGGEMPDFSQMEEAGETGEMPDFSQMPQMSQEGESPDFSPAEDGEGQDFSQMPQMSQEGESSDFSPAEDGEGQDFSQMPQMPETQTSGGMNLLYKIKTYAIPIGIASLLCAVLCLWRFLTLKSKDQSAELPAEDGKEDDDDDDKPRKDPVWKSVVAFVLIGALFLAIFSSNQSTDDSGKTVVSETLSADVSVGSLEEALLGSGSLSESESEDVSFAGDVRVLEWQVGEDEVVVKGQVLATVDKNTVLSSISELKELMDELDDALEDSRDDKLSTTLTAPLAGRIVAVFAQSGDDVQEVVEEYGTLMLLSLDGRLSVDIDAGTLEVGDSLNILREDGTTLSAQVSELMEGVATVTVSDALTNYGESVKVLNSAGEELGSGELDAHRGIGITLFSGTVRTVHVKVGASVWEGQTLITLTDTEYEGEYENLLERRSKLEEQINALYALYDAGAITASATGYVTNLNNSAVGLEDESESAGGMMPFGLSSSGTQGKITLLSAFRPSEDNTVTLLADTPAGDNPGGDTPQTVDTYTLVGTVLSVDPTAGVTVSLLSGGTMVLTVEQLQAVCDVSSLSVGSLLVLSFRTDDDTLYGCTIYTQAGGNTPGGGGSGGGGMASGYSSSTTTTTEEEDYIADETIFCTLTPFNKVDISLSVDELDIRSLYVGQEVEVTLDALEAQVFSATITEIDPNGTNSGGNTKYTVTVTMERTEDMLSGMNASVRIHLSTKESLLLLPAEAIQEDESGVYVFTSYNAKEEDSLSGRTDITTGFSDGSMVEIVSGLSEGDTVWYSYADTVEYTFTK